MEGDHCLLAKFVDYADLDLALLNVKHGISRIALRKHRLIFAIGRNASAAIHSGKKCIDVERGLLLLLVRLHGTILLWALPLRLDCPLTLPFAVQMRERVFH
jgi:hypothetical protein